LLTLITGVRHGELLALIWGDVDRAAGVLTVRTDVVSHNGKTIVKDTTTQ
jgi:integrase